MKKTTIALIVLLSIIGVVGIYYGLYCLHSYGGNNISMRGGCCCCCSGGGMYSGTTGGQVGLAGSGKVGTVIAVPPVSSPPADTVRITINPGTETVTFTPTIPEGSTAAPFAQIWKINRNGIRVPVALLNTGTYELSNTTGMPQTFLIKVYYGVGVDFDEVTFYQPSVNEFTGTYTTGDVTAILHI